MGTHTRAELDAFDCNLGEGGLEEFEPEAEREPTWQRWPAAIAPSRRRIWPFALPVVVAAAVLGAALSWVGMRPGTGTAVRQARAPVAPAAAPAPALTPSPAAIAPPAIVPPAPAVAAIGAVAAPAASAPLPQHESAPLDAGIEPTLAAVSRAYRTLDATSLIPVWPGADLASLSESFAGLKYQTLTFERCRVQPQGTDAALATCDVSIASAPKEGDPALQRRRESWTLALGRSDEQWTIGALIVR